MSKEAATDFWTIVFVVWALMAGGLGYATGERPYYLGAVFFSMSGLLVGSAHRGVLFLLCAALFSALISSAGCVHRPRECVSRRRCSAWPMASASRSATTTVSGGPWPIASSSG